jgi:hypothetical protein
MKIPLVALGLALAGVALAESRFDAQARSHDCQTKYRADLPAGAVAPKADPPIRIQPKLEPESAYACVVVAIDETGQVIDPKVVETDHPAFGEHLLEQVLRAKWRPAMLGGGAFAQQIVVSASYGP